MKDDDRPGRPCTAIFFDIQGVVMAEWVPSGQTVNQKYYIEYGFHMKYSNVTLNPLFTTRQFVIF